MMKLLESLENGVRVSKRCALHRSKVELVELAKWSRLAQFHEESGFSMGG